MKKRKRENEPTDGIMLIVEEDGVNEVFDGRASLGRVYQHSEGRIQQGGLGLRNAHRKDCLQIDLVDLADEGG